ncbi:unnamed protein product [Natator depressus]
MGQSVILRGSMRTLPQWMLERVNAGVHGVIQQKCTKQRTGKEFIIERHEQGS